MIQTIQIQSSGGIYSRVLQCKRFHFRKSSYRASRLQRRLALFLNKTSSCSLLGYCHLGVKAPQGDYCIKANRGVAFGIRLRSHTEVCSLQTSPSVPCASSFLQSLDNLACKIVRLLTFATVLEGEVSLLVVSAHRVEV